MKNEYLFSFRDSLSVTLILFSVIDILGAIPIVIDMRRKAGSIDAVRATLFAGIIMVLFLFLGDSILTLFGVDIESFSIAGAIILFLIGMEMVLGKHIFTPSTETRGTSLVPLAFPIIAGTGTMTTIMSLRAEYGIINILTGILLNLGVVYFVLRISGKLESMLGTAGADILRKVFGTVLLAISIKIFKTHLHF